MKNKNKLFEEFPPVSREEWEEMIEKDLRSAGYKTKLNWETGEGIEALPFYRKEDLKDIPSSALKDENDWEIRQPVIEQDIRKANKTAKKAIKNGAGALEFRLNIRRTEGNIGGDLEGIAIQNQEAFSKLVDGIDLTKTPLHFDSGLASPIILAMLHNEMKAQNLDHSAISGSVMYDPYAFIITKGQLPEEEEMLQSEAKQMVDFCETRLPVMKCLGVEGRVYHNAGGTVVQELGYALAVGSEYLAKLSDAGLEMNAIASAIHFNFSIGSNYFIEIAKFRAARKLWRKILDEYEVDAEQKMYLHGSSSEWNKTKYDPYVNMLRTTTEGMSAAVAGCDGITLHPFDATFRQPGEFSERIARNSQIILKEEAYLDKVADPAAGSYYIEILTDKIAEGTWNCFQEVERQGGFFKSIHGGYVQSAIEESRDLRNESIAKRGRIFVGTNQYPNPNDKAPKKEPVGEATQSLLETDESADIKLDQLLTTIKQSLQNGCSLGDLIPALFNYQREDIRPIRPYYGPQAFEDLRQATENHETTPQVLTLPIGDKKMRKARSAFTVNFFGCAGYNIDDPIGFDSIDDAVTEIRNQQPDIVVLCSSDGEYEELVPELCGKVDELEQQPIVVLAGYPKEHIEQYKNAGIDVFIHNQSNVLETLTDFQKRLGVI